MWKIEKKNKMSMKTIIVFFKEAEESRQYWGLHKFILEDELMDIKKLSDLAFDNPELGFRKWEIKIIGENKFVTNENTKILATNNDFISDTYWSKRKTIKQLCKSIKKEFENKILI